MYFVCNYFIFFGSDLCLEDNNEESSVLPNNDANDFEFDNLNVNLSGNGNENDISIETHKKEYVFSLYLKTYFITNDF